MNSDSENINIRVSAVIPAYNAENCIGRAIESVLNQSLPVYEIIVIDDGSTDKTSEVIKLYCDKVKLIIQKNAGVSVARNKGIEAAKGNWIAFLDADDEWLRDKNKSQIGIIKHNNDLKWCAANSQISLNDNCKPAGNEKEIYANLDKNSCFENFFHVQMKRGCPTHTPTMMIKKDVFDEVAKFAPGRKRSEDLEVWWQIAMHYPKIGYEPTPQITVHLEEHEELLVSDRISEKRGDDIRQVVANCLALSKSIGVEKDFEPFASMYLKRRIRTMLFNGFGNEAKETISQFANFFEWWFKSCVFVLAIFPGFTSTAMRGISHLKHVLKLNNQVTRRYSLRQVQKSDNHLR